MVREYDPIFRKPLGSAESLQRLSQQLNRLVVFEHFSNSIPARVKSSHLTVNPKSTPIRAQLARTLGKAREWWVNAKPPRPRACLTNRALDDAPYSRSATSRRLRL